MAVTWTISPLCRMPRLDEPALRQSLGIPDDRRVFAYTAAQAEPFVSRATPADIVRWWAKTQDAYRTQLKQEVRWDETSTIEQDADYDASQQIELRYVAAFIDRFGLDRLASGYRNRELTGFADRELDAWMRYRGYASRLPQIAVDPGILLPFTADLVLAVPDWTGRETRFGSLARVADELARLMADIATASPSAGVEGLTDDFHDDRLTNAFTGARLRLQQVREAIQLGLPLWSSG